MSLYVLDSDIFSHFEGNNPTVIRRVLEIPPDARYISAVTLRERLDGWYQLCGRVKTPEDEERVYERLTRTVKICSVVQVLPYTVACIGRFRELQAMKLNVRPMDLRIAAVALENGATLVTRNTRDSARIPGLSLEDWSAHQEEA